MPEESPIVVAVPSDPESLDPMLAVGPAARQVASLLWPGLVTTDASSGAPAPGLAERWTWWQDGSGMTLTMRAGALWSDGSSVTARDAAASLLAARRASPRGLAPARVTSARALDERTLVVRTAERDCRALRDLEVGILPAAEADRLATSAPTGADAWGRVGGAPGVMELPDRLPPTSGDWRLEDWQPDRELRLEPVARRAVGAPRSGWVLRVQASPSAALADLFAGRADMVRVEAKDVAHVQGRIAAGASVRLVRLPSSDLVLVALNLGDPERPEAGEGDARRVGVEARIGQQGDGHPILADPAVRLALASSIDYQRVIDRAAYGQALRVPADVPPATAWAYASALPPTATDPEGARARLETAGWIDRDGDGTRERGGRRLALELLASQGNSAHEQAADEIRRGLGSVGVDVRLHPVDYGVLLGAVLDQTYDMALMAWHDLPSDADPGDRWAPQGDRPGLGPNMTSLADDRLVALLTAARKTPGCAPAARASYYRQAQARLQALAPILPLYSPLLVYALGPRLAHVDPQPWSPYGLPTVTPD